MARPDMRDLFGMVLDRPPAERLAFLREACGGDHALYNEIVELLRIEAELEAAAPPDAEADPFVGRRLGAYRVERLVGRGAMGRVYLARRSDGSFDRRVAVKVIAPEASSPAIVARFEQERRLAAALDHPCIAALIDAGRSEDGHLYFVMEYVDGLPLIRYCDEHRLALEGRLALFRRVCDGVSHAHRNLIVHRDLKPGNILVDGAGTPKLLDFGIAKPITPAGLEDGHPTALEDKRATRGYASPEQLDGAAAHVAMDVYSLGAILYELLTGSLPRASDAESGTETGFYRKPSAMDRPGVEPRGRSMDDDLDAIALKALHPDRQQRYATADALSADIQRFLEHRPVTARRAGRAYRARKFVRRNRIGVAVAAVLVVAIGTAIGALSSAARRADADRARAERRFADARALAASLFDVDAQLGRVPGATRPRRALVESVSRYLDALRPEAGEPGALAVEIAEGYRRLGDVQGNPNVANLGDTAGALASYDKAKALLAGALQDDAGVRFALAQVHASRADVLYERRDLAGAESSAREALALADALGAASPDEPRYAELSSGVLRRLGDVRRAAADPRAALGHYQAALRIDAGLARRFDGRPEYQRLIALSEIRVAAASADAGSPAEARAALERAAEILARLDRAGVGGAAIRRELFVANAQLGVMLEQGGDRAGRRLVRTAVDGFRTAAAQDPNDARVRADLARALVQYGDVLRAGEAAAARQAYTDAEQQVRLLPISEQDREHALVAAIRQRTEALASRATAPGMRLTLVRGGARATLEAGDPPSADTELIVEPSSRTAGARYLLLFGAQGRPQLLDERQLSGNAWSVKAAGPPPAQTVMLITAEQPLTAADRDAIVAAVTNAGDERTVDSDSVVAWASQSEIQVESAAAARGLQTPRWIEGVAARLARIRGIAFTARTFPLAPAR